MNICEPEQLQAFDSFSHIWHFNFNHYWFLLSCDLIYLSVFSFAYQEEMAEAILYGVAQMIIENLGSMVFAEIGSMLGVEDEFGKLKDTVSTVQAVLLDAEEQQVKNQQVKHWLVRLRDAVYDADDLLTEFYTEDMRQRMMGGDETAKSVSTSFTTYIKPTFIISSLKQLASRRDMAKKITSMRERFAAIANDMNKFKFVAHPSETRVVTWERDQTSSFVCKEEVIG